MYVNIARVTIDIPERTFNPNYSISYAERITLIGRIESR